jgi:hypothetical protein
MWRWLSKISPSANMGRARPALSKTRLVQKKEFFHPRFGAKKTIFWAAAKKTKKLGRKKNCPAQPYITPCPKAQKGIDF